MCTKCTVLFNLALAKTIGCGSLQYPDDEGMEPEPVLSNTTCLFRKPHKIQPINNKILKFGMLRNE